MAHRTPGGWRQSTAELCRMLRHDFRRTAVRNMVNRSIREPVYVWADGSYVKAGLEKAKAGDACAHRGTPSRAEGRPGGGERVSGVDGELGRAAPGPQGPGVAGAAAAHCRRAPGHQGRGGRPVPDGRRAAVLEASLRERARHAAEALQAEVRARLTTSPYAETQAEAERQKRAFQAWAAKKGVAAAGRRLAEDWERLVPFYAFPKKHWKHLRTTNVVESPFAAVRLRTDAAKRFKEVANATAVIWKRLLVSEQRFRRLDAPERLPEVAEGVVYVDGVRKPVDGVRKPLQAIRRIQMLPPSFFRHSGISTANRSRWKCSRKVLNRTISKAELNARKARRR
jgi:putative transposase